MYSRNNVRRIVFSLFQLIGCLWFCFIRIEKIWKFEESFLYNLTIERKRKTSIVIFYT